MLQTSSQAFGRAAHELRTAWDEQLLGRPDVDVLERATSEGRVVVTHDLAFGRAAVRTGTPFVGIIYRSRTHLRSIVLAVIDALRASTVEVQPPLFAVAARQQSTVPRSCTNGAAVVDI